MQKIALGLILVLVLVLAGNFNSVIPTLPIKVKADDIPKPEFNFVNQQFAYTELDHKTIEHQISYKLQKEEGQVKVLYRTGIHFSAGSAASGHCNGTGNFARGNFDLYDLDQVWVDGEEVNVKGEKGAYYLLVLQSVESNVSGYACKINGGLPRVFGLALPPSQQSNNPVIVEDLNELNFRMAGGGETSIYAWYVKEFSNFLYRNNADHKSLNISKAPGEDLTAVQQKQFDKALNECKDLIISRVTEGSSLPKEIAEIFNNLDPDKKYFKEHNPGNLFSSYDSGHYVAFYSSNKGNTSDRHFTQNSASQSAFQELDQKFSLVLSAHSGEFGEEVVDLIAGGAVGTLVLSASKKPLWAGGAAVATIGGINIAREKFENIILGKASNELLPLILAKYYIDKHLEYHSCVSLKAPDLPAEHPFSKETLAEEELNVKRVVEGSLIEDMEGLNEVEGNDCGFDFGNQALEKVMCSMVKAIMSVMANFFDKSMDFLQSTLDSSVSDTTSKQTSP